MVHQEHNYTKAAKDSLQITQYFTTQLLQAESKIIEEKELDKELPDRESPDKESDNESDNEPNEELDEDSEEFENEIDIDNNFSNKMEALEIILHQNKKKISVYCMNIYRKEITGKLAIFAEKKYKSHRRVPDDIFNQITLNNNNE